MEHHGIFQDIIRYLAGEEVDFSYYEPDLSGLTAFQQDVLREVRKIPYGKTITYAELARSIGREGAWRAVGSALAVNPYPIIIPCHRVVSSTGIGGFCGDDRGDKVELKRKMLDMEAANVIKRGVDRYNASLDQSMHQ